METKEVTVTEVTTDQLVKALMQLIAPTPATFIARTELKMNKKGNPYHGLIQKEQRSNVFINFNYQNSVNRARIKEGKEADFVAAPRAWGQKVPGTPLVIHEGHYYLEARFLNNEQKVEYYKKDKSIDKKLFEEFLPKEKVVENAIDASGRQELKEKIVIRTFKIEGIKEIQFGGTKYVVVNKK